MLGFRPPPKLKGIPVSRQPDSSGPVHSGRSAGALVIVGTGIQWAGQTTLAAHRAIEAADRVLFAVADAGTAAWLRSLRSDAVSLRYDEGDRAPRREIYRRMAEDILAEVRKGLRVCAVFYGHPGVFCTPAHEAARQSRQEGFDTRLLPGVSFLDCLFADLGIDPGREGCIAYEATDFLVRRRPFDTHTPLVLSQIALIGNPYAFASGAAERIRKGLAVLSEALRARYPASHEVLVYHASTHPLEPPRLSRHRLEDLTSVAVDELSTLYVPPVSPAPMDSGMRARLGLEGSTPK